MYHLAVATTSLLFRMNFNAQAAQVLAGSQQLQVLFQARVFDVPALQSFAPGLWPFHLWNPACPHGGLSWTPFLQGKSQSNSGSSWLLPWVLKIDLWQGSRQTQTMCCYCNSWKGQSLRLDWDVEWTWSFRWHLKLISWTLKKKQRFSIELLTWSVRFGGYLELRPWHREWSRRPDMMRRSQERTWTGRFASLPQRHC